MSLPPAVYEYRPAYYLKGGAVTLGEASQSAREFLVALTAEQERREAVGLRPYTHVAVIFEL